MFSSTGLGLASILSPLPAIISRLIPPPPPSLRLACDWRFPPHAPTLPLVPLSFSRKKKNDTNMTHLTKKGDLLLEAVPRPHRPPREGSSPRGGGAEPGEGPSPEGCSVGGGAGRNLLRKAGVPLRLGEKNSRLCPMKHSRIVGLVVGIVADGRTYVRALLVLFAEVMHPLLLHQVFHLYCIEIITFSDQERQPQHPKATDPTPT